MLAPLCDYTASPQQRHQGENCLPDWRNTAGTVIASSSDYQDFDRSADLSLAQPRLDAKARVRRGGQRLSQVERVLRSKRRLVESSQHGVKRNLTSSHFAKRDRRAFPEALPERWPRESAPCPPPSRIRRTGQA